VGAFEQLTALPLAREHSHHVPLVNGVFYSAAGSASATGMQKQVFGGRLE
jgi:hypothetical protein